MADGDRNHPTTGKWFSRDKSEQKREPVPGEKPNPWKPIVFIVECRDCGESFGVNESCVDYDVGRTVMDGNRVMLVWLPASCPRCRNLKVVGG